jgi:hypothetical protein
LISNILKQIIKVNTTFKCHFVKKNGELREMICIYDHMHNNDNLIVVWDIQNEGYRCVNLNTVKDISFRKLKLTMDITR